MKRHRAKITAHNRVFNRSARTSASVNLDTVGLDVNTFVSPLTRVKRIIPVKMEVSVLFNHTTQLMPKSVIARALIGMLSMVIDVKETIQSMPNMIFATMQKDSRMMENVTMNMLGRVNNVMK